MFAHFLKAFGQIDDRNFRSVLLRGVLSALLALILAGFAARYGLAVLAGSYFTLPSWIVDLGAAAVFLMAGWFLFPAIATTIMSLFLDDVVDAVEDTHYPQQKAASSISLAKATILSLKLGALVIFVNLLALPFYVLLLFTAIGPFILFAALNGYLLGREYFEMVAMRHMPARDAAQMRRENRPAVFALGLGVTGLFMVPILNLIAPIVGAAAAVHAFHKLAREDRWTIQGRNA